MHSIHWPTDLMPGNTKDFVSRQIIARGLYPQFSKSRCP